MHFGCYGNARDKFSLKCSAGPMNKCRAGHLSDDEMVETPMPGRVRRVVKQRRQQKVAKVGLLESTHSLTG